jgi:hypothetical protein
MVLGVPPDLATLFRVLYRATRTERLLVVPKPARVSMSMSSGIVSATGLFRVTRPRRLPNGFGATPPLFSIS